MASISTNYMEIAMSDSEDNILYCTVVRTFKTLEEAKEAYMKAKQQFHSAPILALAVQ